MPQKSNYVRARAAPTAHGYDRALRSYVEYGSHEGLRAGPYIGFRCIPPAGTQNDTWHALKSPNGSLLEFRWLAADRAWWPRLQRGWRVAFPAEYLSSHGWQYVRPSKAALLPER